jgi:tRNA A-37 threonylcarbamoyl transferase component Bud32
LSDALERDPQERGPFLDNECGGDAELRAEVESLLASHQKAGVFLETPAALASGLVPAPEGDDALAGGMLGPYHMARQLGRGGMGVVYLAEDTRLGRKVAVKILPKEYSTDKARKERLRLEARAAAALSHPAIATVFSLEELDGRLCLVSEYVRGDTLRAELDHGPFSLDLLIDTGIQVARGLAAAHAAGVIHRDLKPDNIIRSIQGEVKILDFGIAHLEAPGAASAPRLTAVGQAIGTPGYMSPEQLDGAEIDPRADIFALGVLLYELATASHPFTGPTPAATIANVYAANPPQLNGLDGRLPQQLDAIVRRCVRRNRGERYSSALDVARDLQDLRDGRLRAPARTGQAPSKLSSPLWWWQIHQLCVILVESGLVVAVARVYRMDARDWTLALLLAYVATVVLNGTLRLHLLFTRAFNGGGMSEQLRRTMPIARGTDMVIGALLLAAAAAAVHGSVHLSATLAAFAVGWTVVSLVVEPATRAAAFRPDPDLTPQR